MLFGFYMLGIVLAVQRIYALLLKVNRNAAFLQFADGGQGIDRVSGEAGNGLRKDYGRL